MAILGQAITSASGLLRVAETQYGANLFGNTSINTGFNTNMTTFYSTTAAEKRAEGVILYGTAFIPEARYEKVVVEWSDYWSGGFGNPYEIGLATSQSVYTNKAASNSRPTHQVLAMAWDLLWNWLGSYSSTFTILPSPSGLLATPPGTVWSDGGGTWDRKEYIINNNPTEIGVNFKMVFTSVVEDGWFYVGANHSAEAGFVAYSSYLSPESVSPRDVRSLTTSGRKTWAPYRRSKDGIEFEKDIYSYDYESMEALNAKVQNSLEQGYPVWVPSSEVFIWLIGRTTVKVTT